MPSKSAAVEHAKSVAAANQPSQVVLLDEFGRLIPIAHGNKVVGASGFESPTS